MVFNKELVEHRLYYDESSIIKLVVSKEKSDNLDLFYFGEIEVYDKFGNKLSLIISSFSESSSGTPLTNTIDNNKNTWGDLLPVTDEYYVSYIVDGISNLDDIESIKIY